MKLNISLSRDKPIKQTTEVITPKEAVTPKFLGSRIDAESSPDRRVFNAVMQNMPIRNIQEGKITEADIGLALTTPILGQYVPMFNWADDWAYYWEYLDTYLLVPEAAFALDKKNELIWKRGFDIETEDDSAREQFMRLWVELNLDKAFFDLTRNALLYGNGYAESVDNSKAVWADQPLAVGYSTGQRQLVSYKEATEFYGLKTLDSRTIRKLVDPKTWDNMRHEPYVERYIQRFWTSPTVRNQSDLANQKDASCEYNFYPDQMLHLKFNDLGGTYGYSLFRKAYFTIKAYLVMLQYLPQIVAKRADPGLIFKYGGNVKDSNGADYTVLPSNNTADYEQWKNGLMYKASGEDLYADFLTSVEQIYQNEGQLRGINELIQIWKERVFIGVNMPTSLTDPLGRAQGEIKWGDLKFEMLENEILGYQRAVERLINTQVIPRLVTDKKARFRFNSITPDDWRADEAPLADLWTKKAINLSYLLQRLKIPPEAAKGLPEVYGEGDEDKEKPEDDKGEEAQEKYVISRVKTKPHLHS